MNEIMTTKSVNLMGSEILAAQDNNGVVWAGVRWMCDGLGLSEGQRKRQIANIQADKVLFRGGSNLRLPTNGGVQEVFCLKLDFLPLWLAKISITPTMEEETPEVAEMLVQYQLKAKDVLAEAFLPKKKEPTCIEDILIQSLQEMKEVKNQIQAVNVRVDNIGEVIALDTTSWRKDSHDLIVGIAQKLGGNEYLRNINGEIYKLVDLRGGVSLATRLTNKKNRMAGEGACKSARDKLNRLDVIADDKKLIEIYVAIVKEMAVKHGVTLFNGVNDGTRYANAGVCVSKSNAAPCQTLA